MPQSLPCPLSQITNFIQIHFPSGHQGSCITPPSHILHLVTQGQYHLSINKHQFQAQAGDFIIYHDLDQVTWIENTEPVSFYSILFHAEQLPALGMPKRLASLSKKDFTTFQQRFTEQFNQFQPPYHQQFALCALLLESLQQLYPLRSDADNDKRSLWQLLEQRLRIDGNFRPSLNQCCAISGMSSASLSRLSNEIYQQSPMQRLRFVRIEQAKSLLQLSSMSISQIAAYLNYPRVHEFSREFKQQTQTSPKQFRQQCLA